MDTIVEMLTFTFIVSIFFAAYLLSLKGKLSDKKGYEKESIFTKLDVKRAFKTVLRGLNSTYSIDEINEDETSILLCDKFEFINGGNYYMVSCKSGSKITEIEVGIKSKFFGRTDIYLSRLVNLIRSSLLQEE